MYFATGFNSGYPGYADREGFTSGRDGARFRFGHAFDTTAGTKTRGVKVDMPLYAWASVIVDGRVVATDYAPDTGWLLPSPGANPGDPDTPGADPGGPDTTGADPGGPDTPDVQLRGTYLLEDRFPVRLSMTVGDGWTAVNERRFYHAGSVTRDEGSNGLRFVMVDNLDNEACAKRAAAIDGRATVDDVVAFLARLRLIDIRRTRMSRSLAIAGGMSSSRGPPVNRLGGWGDRWLAGELANRQGRTRPGVDPRRRWRGPGDRRVLIPGSL